MKTFPTSLRYFLFSLFVRLICFTQPYLYEFEMGTCEDYGTHYSVLSFFLTSFMGLPFLAFQAIFAVSIISPLRNYFCTGYLHELKVPGKWARL